MAAKITVEQATEALAPFLNHHNGQSSVNPGKVRGSDRVVVNTPWGDDSLLFVVPDDIEKFAEALNNLYLPERLTAVWHRDTSDLEILWTAFPLTGERKDFPGRRFVFKSSGKEYTCEFAQSSDRVLELAKSFQPIFQSATHHRNMESYNFYSRHHAVVPAAQPYSFWIRKISWNEDAVMALVSHLNFYLAYYDTKSPTVLLHSPKSEVQATQPQTRYSAGKFPEQIAAKDIDDNLLHFWDACQNGDPARRFIYCYRIIEYASFSYLDATTRTAVRKILSAPNALDDIAGVSDRVVNAIPRSQSAQQETQRVEAMLHETVDPALLWREVSLNLPAFISDTKFDGGYEVKAIARAGWSEADYVLKGIETFASTTRGIRNALSHGRDQRTAAVIAPTTRNFERLQPWVSLITVAAGEVILYRDTL